MIVKQRMVLISPLVYSLSEGIKVHNVYRLVKPTDKCYSSGLEHST